MKLVAETIELPENASWQQIEDAKASAVWREVRSKNDLMKRTSLDNKCGSCKHFKQYPYPCRQYGDCEFPERASYRQRTAKACKKYEKKEI